MDPFRDGKGGGGGSERLTDAGGFGSVQLKNSSDNYVGHVRSRGG